MRAAAVLTALALVAALFVFQQRGTERNSAVPPRSASPPLAQPPAPVDLAEVETQAQRTEPSAPSAELEPGAPLQSSAPGSLRGQVLDLAGRPLEGVQVGLWLDSDASRARTEVRADAQGAFEFTDVPEGDVTLRANPEDAGIAVSTVQLELEEGQSAAGLVLVVVPEKSIEGWIRGPRGEGLAEVPVRFYWNEDEPSPLVGWGSFNAKAITDDRGYFRAEGLPCVEYDVNVLLERHESLFATVPAESRTLELQARTTYEHVDLRGRLVDSGGAPVAGATVQLQGLPRHGEDITDGDGRFRIGSRASWDTEWRTDPVLTVCAEGYASTRFELTLEQVTEGPIELVLERERPFAGFVVDGSGERIDAYVHIWSRGLDDLFDDPVRACDHDWHKCSASEGFEAHGLGPGPFDVLVRSGDSEHHSRHVLEAGASPFVLGPSDPADSLVLFEVTARNAETGERLDRFALGIYDEEGGGSVLRDWPDGVATDWERGPATLRVKVKADGFGSIEFPERPFEPGLYRLSASLVPTRTLLLRVVEPDGSPVRGALISIPGWPESAVDADAGHRPVWGARGTTGIDGRCEIHSVPAGAASILVQRSASSPKVEMALSEPDARGERALVLPIR